MTCILFQIGKVHTSDYRPYVGSRVRPKNREGLVDLLEGVRVNIGQRQGWGSESVT